MDVLTHLPDVGWPLLILVASVVTFEVGMALTVMAVPDRRHRQPTASDRRKLRRIWIGVLGFWPTVIGLVWAHTTLPMPAWLALDLAIAGALAWFIGHALWLRSHPKVEGAAHCRHCGYALVGLVNPTHCPECGHPIPPRKPHKTPAKAQPDQG